MIIKVFLFFIISSTALAQQVPIKEKERRGFNVGIQKEVILDKIDSVPIGLSSSDITPPLITLKGQYQPNFTTKFQPDISFAFSSIGGGGQYLYLQAGGWFDFPKFHLFLGGEVLASLYGADLEDSPIDHIGFGGYVKAGMPLGIFYPTLEIRYRELKETEIANGEGLNTYVGHDGDTLVRPALTVDLSVIKLWGAFTYYSVGDTAIASDGFGLGIKADPFYIFSVGAGFSLGSTHFWVKAHQITDIEDEVAHFYQVPQIYPDFLMAKQTASLEVQWQF